MALYSCPDCKKEFSSEAKACPNCGWRRKSGATGCLVAAGIGAMLIFSFFYFAPDPKVVERLQAEATAADQLQHARDQIAAAPLPSVIDASDPALQPAGTYEFISTATNGNMPVISGTTSVPDGTVLVINIKRPWLPDGQERLARGLSACGDSCFPATGPAGESFGVDAVVKDGAFSAGPFSFGGQPFPPGLYPLEIFVRPNQSNAATSEGINALANPAATGQIQVQEDVQP